MMKDYTKKEYIQLSFRKFCAENKHKIVGFVKD